MDNTGRREEPATATPEPEARPAGPDPAPAPRQDFTVAVTPAQLAAGAAILAGLILLVARRRRGRTRA